MGDCEDNGCHARFPIVGTGHRSLREIAGTVAVDLEKPLQRDDGEDRHRGVLDGGREAEDLPCALFAVRLRESPW